MNLNSRPIRMGVGAIIGVQVESRVRGAIPAGIAANGDVVLLAAVIAYLAWSGRPSDGALGDVLDGVAIGIAASTSTRVIKLPV